jgi:DnaJ family protein C protein 17
LKVVWNRRDGDYSAAALRAIFAAFGPVEDVVLKDGRKARAGALVLMATTAAAVRSACARGGAVLCCVCVKTPALTRCVCSVLFPCVQRAAAGSPCGDMSHPLLVLPAGRDGGGDDDDDGGVMGGGGGAPAASARRPHSTFPAASPPAAAAAAAPAMASPLFASFGSAGAGGSAARSPFASFPGAGASAFGASPTSFPSFASAAGGSGVGASARDYESATLHALRTAAERARALAAATAEDAAQQAAP